MNNIIKINLKMFMISMSRININLVHNQENVNT